MKTGIKNMFLLGTIAMGLVAGVIACKDDDKNSTIVGGSDAVHVTEEAVKNYSLLGDWRGGDLVYTLVQIEDTLKKNPTMLDEIASEPASNTHLCFTEDSIFVVDSSYAYQSGSTTGSIYIVAWIVKVSGHYTYDNGIQVLSFDGLKGTIEKDTIWSSRKSGQTTELSEKDLGVLMKSSVIWSNGGNIVNFEKTPLRTSASAIKERGTNSFYRFLFAKEE